MGMPSCKRCLPRNFQYLAIVMEVCLQLFYLLFILNPFVIWGSTAYITKDDIEIWPKSMRDSSYWNQQIRAELQNIYTDSFESLWFRYVDTVKNIYEKRKDGDLCMEEVKRGQCPMLIVHGAKDRLCPQFHADYLKENIRGSEMVVMEEGTHALQFKCAQEFNLLSEQFLLNNIN